MYNQVTGPPDEGLWEQGGRAQEELKINRRSQQILYVALTTIQVLIVSSPSSTQEVGVVPTPHYGLENRGTEVWWEEQIKGAWVPSLCSHTSDRHGLSIMKATCVITLPSSKEERRHR